MAVASPEWLVVNARSAPFAWSTESVTLVASVQNLRPHFLFSAGLLAG
jgi:hypothetical protein